jgi:hypothetical protein
VLEMILEREWMNTPRKKKVEYFEKKDDKKEM